MSAKIQELLHKNHMVTSKQLSLLFDERTVREALLLYGQKRPDQVICRFMMREKQTDKIIIGTQYIKKIFDMIRTGKFNMENIVPLGALDENCPIEMFLDEAYPNKIQKIGQIIPKKVKPRPYLIDNSKKSLAKKPSQSKNIKPDKSLKNINPNTIKNTNEAQKISTEHKFQKKQVENVKQKKQQQKFEQNKKVEAVVKNNKKLTVQSDSSDNEQKILSKFRIQSDQTKPSPKTQVSEQITREQRNNVKNLMNGGIEKVSSQECKQQVQQKLAEMELDEEDAYEILLKKQKMNAAGKVQNKNHNIPDKPQKKIAEKVPQNAQLKPKSATSESQPKLQAGQSTLFNFMKKK